MRKILVVIGFFCLVLASCATAKVPSYCGQYTIPKKAFNQEVFYSSGCDTAYFEGKSYELLVNEEFTDSLSRLKSSISINCTYYDPNSVNSAKRNDGSWLGRKLYGENTYNAMYLEPVTDNEYSMGQRIAYTKDGVLHLKALSYKKNNDWHLYLPRIEMNRIFERNIMVEIRYKLPVKGNDVAYHVGLNLSDKSHFNEQGWKWHQLYLGEILSAVPNKIVYTSNMFFGKQTNRKAKNGNEVWTKDYVSDTNWNTSYQIYNSNANLYPMPDSEFYEWHVMTAVYDDEKFAVWHDGVQTYEWKWEDYPNIGMPQDDIRSRKIGGVRVFFEMGLAGEWSEIQQNIPNIGHFKDFTGKELEIDYIRVYKSN